MSFSVDCTRHCTGCLCLCLQENFAINASQSYTGDETWQGIEQQSESQPRSLGENGCARLPSEMSERGSKDESHDVRLLNARLDVSLCLCR